MESTLPSGPKPTKEAYLSNLRTLKEHHKSGDDDMIAQRNSPLKSMKGKAVLCIEELIAEKEAAETKLLLGTKVISDGSVLSKKIALSVKNNVVVNTPSKPLPVPVPIAKVATASTGNYVPNHVVSKPITRKSENVTVAAVQEKPIKLGRKATRRFAKMSEILPNYKLDKSIKREVVTELQKINCWSDDEEEDLSSKDALGGAGDDESSDSECESGKRQAPAATVDCSMRQAVLGNTSLVENAPGPRAKKAQKGSSSKHAYLEQQKEQARLKARTAIVKKAVKVFVRMRKEEMDLYQKNHFALHGKASLERALIEKLVVFRVNKIMNAAFSSAVERRLKMDRKEQRRQRRRDAAQRVIHRAWRKFRVRFLLGYVIAYIRLKARLFREEQIREEKEFRMRTAMRRVREDRRHKEWLEEQRACPTFPVKEHMVAAQEAQLAKEVQLMEQEIMLQQMHITAKPGSAARTGRFKPASATAKADASSNNSMLLSPRPPSKPPSASVSSREDTINSVFLTQLGFESKSSCSPRAPTHSVASSGTNANSKDASAAADFAFHRPDLAPFSTMINSLITSSTLFRSKAAPQSWSDVASVGADFGATYRQQQQHLKSPAYRALEQLCGVGEAEVTRSKLRTRKEGAEWKLKSFGHSIVSL